MLQVERLTKFYGALRAVEDLSFEVRPGEVFGLLGPNGSGKSTSVKMITGLLRPTRGQVRLDGRDVASDLGALRAELGYVPEEPFLYLYLTGAEYLQLIGRLRRIPEGTLQTRIDRLLQLLDLGDDRYQPLATYSKGMRQKVLIAAAVLHDPRILVLDEPFSGLDATAARVLKAFVRALADDGKLVVFCSHEMHVVEDVCSRVLILKDGHTVGHDSVEHLAAMLHVPSLDAVFAALTAAGDVDARVKGLINAIKAKQGAADVAHA